MSVNGSQDPFVIQAELLSGQFTANVYSAGKSFAAEKAKADAASACEGVLQDKIRVDYPTDGSYPQ